MALLTSFSIAVICYATFTLGTVIILPTLSSDFADPSIIQVGGSWYAYGTGANGINIQVASSPNFGDSWKLWNNRDALLGLPLWVDSKSPYVWAPNVVQIVRAEIQVSIRGAF
jgi:hypothetical protein